MAKNILVTGSNGQLGTELQKISAHTDDHTWYFTDVSELDITDNKQVYRFFLQNKIDTCINCAAYTAVDAAEDEPGKARKVNAEAVKTIADACFKSNALLFHLSTDYVFDGKKKLPYREDDPTNPISIYAKSKALGEKILGLHQVNAVIIRSSWLYASHGHNFLNTILRLAVERPEIKVVNDQVGTPTWANDLATTIMDLIEKIQTPIKEIYHYSNKGAVTWFDFANEIVKISQENCRIIPIKTEDYPAKAKRPLYSVLDKSKIANDFEMMIPNWKESLAKCMQEIRQNNSHVI